MFRGTPLCANRTNVNVRMGATSRTQRVVKVQAAEVSKSKQDKPPKLSERTSQERKALEEFLHTRWNKRMNASFWAFPLGISAVGTANVSAS